MPTVYLDTETTGLDPDRDEILEISVVDDQGNSLIDTRVRPLRLTQWPAAQAIHGIVPEDVRDAPTLEEVLPDVVAAVSGKHLVIYNAAFDLDYLPESVSHAAAGVSCCMTAFAVEYGEYSHYHADFTWQTLTTAAQYVDHSWQGDPHRAASDAQACRAVWHYLTGTEEYRAAVNERRKAAQHRALIEHQVSAALRREDARHQHQQYSRWDEANEASHRVIERFFLRKTAHHWVNDLPQQVRMRKLASVFLGLPDNLPDRCYGAGVEIRTIYQHRREIPEHLAGISWFPKKAWIHRLLDPVAVCVESRTPRLLYEKKQLDAIKAAYSLRFAPTSKHLCSRTQLRRCGVPSAVIDTLTPIAERYNSSGHYWYLLYDPRALDIASSQQHK